MHLQFALLKLSRFLSYTKLAVWARPTMEKWEWTKQLVEEVFKKHCTKKWNFPLRISSVNVTKSAGDWYTQAFSCEFCKISKNNFFTEHLRATASVSIKVPATHIQWQTSFHELLERDGCLNTWTKLAFPPIEIFRTMKGDASLWLEKCFL